LCVWSPTKPNHREMLRERTVRLVGGGQDPRDASHARAVTRLFARGDGHYITVMGCAFPVACNRSKGVWCWHPHLRDTLCIHPPRCPYVMHTLRVLSCTVSCLAELSHVRPGLYSAEHAAEVRPSPGP